MTIDSFLPAKRWIVTALIAIALVSAIALAAPVPARAQGTTDCPILITMYDSLIIRAQPGYGSAVTVQLVAGDIVCMIGRNSDASWVQLRRPAPSYGAVGWGPASAFTTTVPITILPVTDGTPPVTPPPVVTPTPPPVTPAPGGQTYVVQAGDYLASIARRFGVTLTALIQANNVQPPNYVIYAGQVLVIPGTTPTQPPTGYTQYTVKQGDYLVSIGNQFGVHWSTLATVNNIQSPYVIYPGQVLMIPTG